MKYIVCIMIGLPYEYVLHLLMTSYYLCGRFDGQNFEETWLFVSVITVPSYQTTDGSISQISYNFPHRLSVKICGPTDYFDRHFGEIY